MFPLACLLLTLVVQNPYALEIEAERRERDVHFQNAYESPLATVAIKLIEEGEIVVGSSAAAGLRWQAPGVRGRHLRVRSEEGRVIAEALDGQVTAYPSGAAWESGEWLKGERLQLGSVLVVLQQHPVGPVIRVVDPSTPALDQFRGLHYFPIDPSYRVSARIEPGPKKEISILDTQGWKRPAWIYGRAYFEIAGDQQSLDLILFDKDPTPESEFMLIFRDRTSGRESYPACRYLYVPFSEKGPLWIDFNRTFNPYCAYGKGFACPLPPRGNTLTVAIRAGEKTYPLEH